MIQILKYNDAELCPRPNQRTCWGHFGSSRGQDSAYRRSSSLYIHHPTIPNPHSVHLKSMINKQTNKQWVNIITFTHNVNLMSINKQTDGHHHYTFTTQPSPIPLVFILNPRQTNKQEIKKYRPAIAHLLM